MKELIDQLDEVYQDIVVNGEILAKGVRDCRSRWEIIKDHCGPHNVILEVGSAQGYFTTQMARTYPDSLIVSFESDSVSCEIQKEICRREGLYNVVVCNHRLSRLDLETLSDCVECFDVVLALSVLHHFSGDDVRSVYEAMIKLAPEVIHELPNQEENACGKDSVRHGDYGYEGTTWLGSTSSHLSGERDIVQKENDHIQRKGVDAYFGVSHEDRHKFDLQCDWGTWRMNDKFMTKGMNVHNLMQFNPVWPKARWWKEQARAAYHGLDFKSDVRLWNLLMTSTGLKAIDYMTKFPDGDQAEYKLGDIHKLQEQIDENF